MWYAHLWWVSTETRDPLKIGQWLGIGIVALGTEVQFSDEDDMVITCLMHKFVLDSSPDVRLYSYTVDLQVTNSG
jgi:hypothetical protein